MRVAVVMEQCLGPVPGGTGRYTAEVAGALARRPGVEVTGWVAWHRDTEAAQQPGVRGPRRLPLPRRALVLAWEHGRAPRVGGPVDVVHAPTLLVPPVGDAPRVVTVHDVVPWTHPDTLTPRGVRWHRAMAARAAHADVVVVPTHAVAEELQRVLQPRRLEVVGEGISERLTEPTDADDRARALELPGEYLLTLATLEPRKGLDVLVGALARGGAPDVPLLVVGQPGWGGVDLPVLTAAAGLAPGRVRHLGRLSDADLAVVLRRATALVVPSRAEGFGLPVLEAMAAGVPVVTSSAPALVEVGGDAVAVAPVGDEHALAQVLGEVVEDPALRAGMTARGWVRAGAYSWDAAAERLVAIYRSL